jgi:hypothetical protein
MRGAAAAGLAVAVVIGLAACGSSDDDGGGDASGTQIPVATTSAPSGVEPVQVTSPAGGGGGGEGTTPAEVGAVLLGTAVATVSGGENPAGQSGDVERRGQECTGVGTLAGLEPGASVAVRDAATGASLGTGIVEATTAQQIKDSSDGSPPEWDCRFPFRVALSAPATDVAVQIAGLPELFGTIDDGQLTLVVPNDVTTPKPPPEDTLPEVSEPEVSVLDLNLPDY